MELLPQIAFGYGRVSTAKQGLSRQAQTETVARAAEYHTGGAAQEVFFDEDTSAGIPFDLNELANARGRMGIGIEIDMHFKPQTLAACREAIATSAN